MLQVINISIDVREMFGIVWVVANCAPIKLNFLFMVNVFINSEDYIYWFFIIVFVFFLNISNYFIFI